MSAEPVFMLTGAVIGQLGAIIYAWNKWSDPKASSIDIVSVFFSGWFLGICVVHLLPLFLMLWVPYKIVRYLRPKQNPEEA